jgi:hypothetical protein
MRHRFNVGAPGCDLADPSDRAEDDLQLPGEQLEFGVGHRQSGELGEMGDVVGLNLDFGWHDYAV